MPDAQTNSRLTTKVAAPELPSQAGLMTLAVGVVVIAALYVAREVLIPITLAVLLSFVLAPLVQRLRRLGLWRVPAVFLAVVLALGVIVLLAGIIGTQLASLGDRAGDYAEVIQHKVDSVRGFANRQIEGFTSRIGGAAEPPARQARGPRPDAPKPTPVEVHQPDPSPIEIAERLAAPIVAPLGSLGIVLVVAVFILMQMEDLRDRIIRLFGSGDLHRTTAAMDDAAGRLSRYFLAQLALNACFGVVVGGSLFLLGIPSPALLGIIAGLLRFAPYVGAAGAALLPLLLAAAVDPGWGLVIEVAILFVVIEGVTGQVIEPLLYGHSTGLSPVSVVIAAVFWTWLWGPVGLILSMPLTLCLVVLGRHVERLQFIAVLLGDQPALSPAESFYQRMLAGDADEALDQAELLLRERSLTGYYDEVALRGLHMAANDQIRGVLTPEQRDNVVDAVGEVVMDLADHEDQGPRAEPPATAGTVMCIGGRGPLDDAACMMLAQVLAKRGMSARVVSQGAVGRGAIDALDIAGVAVVVVSYLEASGSLSGLRYLMRRLRHRAPGVPIVVGLWQASGDDMSRERVHSVTGADAYVRTIEAAAETCLARVQAAPGLEAA